MEFVCDNVTFSCSVESCFVAVRDANGTGNSAHYRLAYADFRSGAWTVAPCGGE